MGSGGGGREIFKFVGREKVLFVKGAMGGKDPARLERTRES